MSYLVNESQVISAIANGPLRDAVKDLVDNISDDIYNTVSSEVYGSGGSEYYDRTYDLLNSVMRGSENKVTVSGRLVHGETGMNPNMIYASPGADNAFNAHMSFDGSSVSDLIIPWFEGDIGNKSPYFRGKVGMIQKAYMHSHNTINKIFWWSFSAYGMKLMGG